MNDTLTIKKLENIIEDVLSNRVDTSPMVIGTGKAEALNYLTALYKEVCKDEELVNEFIKVREEEMPEGFYIIDEFGVHLQK